MAITARQGRRKPPVGSQWKDDERAFAKWMHAKRYPSMGIAHPDIAKTEVDEHGDEITLFTMEHKSTHQLPQFLVKAIQQARVNREKHPAAPAYIGVTYHAPNRKVYRLICREVELSEEFTEDFLEEAA